MKVYIAGPLFCTFERDFLEKITKICEDRGFETFLPHRDAELIEGDNYPPEKLKEVFHADKRGIDDADIIVAVLSGPGIDAGTAWEIGYAHARGKKVIGLVDDFRLKQSMSLMISHTSLLVFSLEELDAELRKIK